MPELEDAEEVAAIKVQKIQIDGLFRLQLKKHERTFRGMQLMISNAKIHNVLTVNHKLQIQLFIVRAAVQITKSKIVKQGSYYVPFSKEPCASTISVFEAVSVTASIHCYFPLRKISLV